MLSTVIQLQRMKYLLPIFLVWPVFVSVPVRRPSETDHPHRMLPSSGIRSLSRIPGSLSRSGNGGLETETNEYQVTQELYEQTFGEIEALILELNTVISKKQFDRWLTYLSTTISEPTILPTNFERNQPVSPAQRQRNCPEGPERLFSVGRGSQPFPGHPRRNRICRRNSGYRLFFI